MQRSEVKVGQRVVTIGEAARRFPGVWIVKKVNPVNVLLTPEHGGRGLNVAPEYIAPEGSTGDLHPTRMVEYRKPLDAGTLVEWDGGRRPGAAGLYVVTKDNGDTANIVRLGGEGGRYWRIPGARGLTVVDVARVTVAPAEQ